MQESSFSLYELNKQIKDSIHSTFSDTYWVVAEISEIREVRSGHCYLELIEKDEKTEQIIAKSRANIWAYTYRMLKPYFMQATGQNLSSGIKILIRVSIDFQEVYGFSLNVRDIDPTYTLGEMAQRKQAILKQLAEEGVIDMNKELALPLVPQKIAVISSPSAAGYGDFCDQLNNNPQGYKFYIKLFQATMQGERTEESVVQALERIYQYDDVFDVVAIIRGGGSTSDLMCFDNYWIAYNIAQFPIPVFSGIGHERDETVVDFVAHTRLKTPTAVAEHLLELVGEFDYRISSLRDRISKETRETLSRHRIRFDHISKNFKPLVKNAILTNENQLSKIAHLVENQTKNYLKSKDHQLIQFTHSLNNSSQNLILEKKQELNQYKLKLAQELRFLFKEEKNKLSLMDKTKELLDPKNILQKGYSITTINGKAVKDAEALNDGDIITTQFSNGKVDSIVTKKGDKV